jgi:5-methylcytosine-specific restriction endonuclease McrA
MSSILTALSRKPGTNRDGTSFDHSTQVAVWCQGQIVAGYDPAKVRKDACGAWIQWDQYGVTVENGKGWEIDHIQPVSRGGSDVIANLQPLQWQNNRHKGDNPPDSWTCLVKAVS